MIACKLSHKSSSDSPFGKLRLSWSPNRAGQDSAWRRGPQSGSLSFSGYLRG